MNTPRTWIIAGLFGVAVAGCNTPTLPLPPPSEDNIEAKIEPGGNASIRGVPNSVEAYALVTCFNNRTGTGVVGLATGKGAFDINMPAAEGDVIEIWQRVGNDPPSVVIQVR